MNSIHEASVWAWITLGSVATLSLIGVIRERLPEWAGLIVGVAPNFVGVFALTFFYLTTRAPTRTSRPDGLRTHFWIGLMVSTLGLVAWETLQLFGNLVFDPADLVATLVGAGASVAVFGGIEARSERTG